MGIPGMNVFSLPSLEEAQRDFFLRFFSPPLLLASPHNPLMLFSCARNSAAKICR